MSQSQLSLITGLVDKIILATDSAVGDMRGINFSISDLAPRVVHHNQSAAGTIVEKRLQDWTMDFPAVFADLDAINKRVHAMKQALMRGAGDATWLAAGG
jgi:hypothetical protein